MKRVTFLETCGVDVYGEKKNASEWDSLLRSDVHTVDAKRGTVAVPAVFSLF